MKSIIIYSRDGCHLCEIMIEELRPLIRGRLDLVVHDVDSRYDWYEKYDTRLPILKMAAMSVFVCVAIGFVGGWVATTKGLAMSDGL
ncbi:MAG: hypothetical protein GWP02_08895, partial [Desulfobulbaceae bacterium]|nr:hypothetical protein [Desulfobulbaceae bacterium]